MALKDWKVTEKIYGRKYIWTKSVHGFESNVMVNRIPQNLKDRGVKENFMVKHDLMVLETFKTRKQAVRFAKSYMRSH